MTKKAMKQMKPKFRRMTLEGEGARFQATTIRELVMAAESMDMTLKISLIPCEPKQRRKSK